MEFPESPKFSAAPIASIFASLTLGEFVLSHLAGRSAGRGFKPSLHLASVLDLVDDVVGDVSMPTTGDDRRFI